MWGASRLSRFPKLGRVPEVFLSGSQAGDFGPELESQALARVEAKVRDLRQEMRAEVERHRLRYLEEHQRAVEEDQERARQYRASVQERVADEQREFERKLAVARKERDDCLDNRKRDARVRQTLESEVEQSKAREEQAEKERAFSFYEE